MPLHLTSGAACELVIFDCDGVLVQSEHLVNRVYVTMMRERGYELDEAQQLHAHSGSHMAARLATYRDELSWEPEPGFIEEFYVRFNAELQCGLAPVDGVRNVLDALTVPACVATNGNAAITRKKLGLAGLTHYFGNRIYSAVDLGAPKPLPDVFLAAAIANDAEPTACIVIEDSVFGVMGAVAAGMTVYGYAAVGDASALREAGAIVFTEMDDFLERASL